MTTDGKVRSVKLAKLVDPEYVSLVKLPANRAGFKVIRSQEEPEGEKIMKELTPRRRTRSKRSDDKLLSIQLPEGSTASQAEEVMTYFGLGDDYTVSERDDGTIYLSRRGVSDEGVDVVHMDIGDGMTANIAVSALRSDKKSNMPGVKLIRMDFDESHFTSTEAVRSWLEERKVDYLEGGVEVVEGGVIVTRADAGEEETRKVKMGDGIVGYVIRAESNDVPTLVYRGVVESSYGNWGWGQLDFAQAMFDPEFTSLSWDALYTLQDVLENIIFYSSLPLAERQALIRNALTQYGEFMSSLIEALPKAVIEAARADRSKSNHKEADMSTVTKEDKAEDKVVREDESASSGKKTETVETKDTDETVKREDGESGDSTKETTDDNTDEGSETITRKDVEDIVAQTVKKTVEAMEAKTTRSDEGTEETTDTDADDNSVEASVAKIARSVADLTKTVEELGNSTVARSDEPDADQDDTDSVQRDDVFAGALGDLGGLKSNP